MTGRTIQLAAVVVAVWACLTGSPGVAHIPYKKVMEEQYPGIVVTCNACHVASKPKSERSQFGDLFYHHMDGETLTRRWNELKDDKEAQKKYEDETMVPLFIAALNDIGEIKTEEGPKYAELIAEGKLEGVKKKKSKD